MANQILRPTQDGTYTTWDGWVGPTVHTTLYDLVNELDYVVGTGDDEYVSTSTSGGAVTFSCSDALAGSWPRATRIRSIRVVAVVRQIGAACDFSFRLRSLDQNLDTPVQTLTATSYTEVGHTFNLGLNATAWDIPTVNRLEVGLVFDSGAEMRCTKLEVYLHYEDFPHYTVQPEADGAIQTWTPTPAGTPNYMTCSGVYDGDLSYLASTVVNDQSVFVLEDLPSTLNPPNIDRVQVKALIKNVGSVVEEADVLLRSATVVYHGGTNTTSIPILPNGAWHLLTEQYLNDPQVAWPSGHPSGTDWTIAEIAALQIGIENSGGGDFRCTSVGLEVWLAPTPVTSIDLYPTADGYHQDQSSIVGAATAWQATDEVVPDNATTHIVLDADTLGISAYTSSDVGGAGTVPAGERIYSVELRFRVRLDNLPHSTALVAPVVRAPRETYVGTPQLLEGMASTWFDVKQDLSTNPHTGAPWTDLAEVTGLEFGFVVLEGAVLLSRTRVQVHTCVDYRAATVDPIDAELTDAATTMITRSQTDGTIYGVTEFSIGNTGYDVTSPESVTAVTTSDTALGLEVYRAGVDRIEYEAHQVDYWCRVPKGVAEGGTGELALWAEIFWSPVAGEIGTKFLYCLAHHPVQSRHPDDVHFYRCRLNYWDLGAELLADGDAEAGPGPDLVVDGDMEYKGTQLVVDGDMELKGTQVVVDGDMEVVGPTVVVDGDMEVVGPTVMVDGSMEAGPGPEIMVDGDMEAAGVVAWTPLDGAALTKDTTSPHGGVQLLRVTDNTVSGAGTAAQTILTLGVTYRVTGYCRSDGASTPHVWNGAAVWSGTSAVSWQAFDVTIVAANVDVRLYFSGSVGGYAEWDDVSVVETCPDWDSVNSPTLTKDTTSPHGGSQALRVTGASGVCARQTIVTVSNVYRARGWARGNGTASPTLWDTSSTLWTGTTSTSWQEFDVTFTAGSTFVGLRSVSGGAADWVEWDDVIITDAAVDTADWLVGNSAILSKQAGSPGGSGSQVLRVEYNGTTNPYARQYILVLTSVYRVTGYARGDGTFAPYISYGGTAVWTGTSSTSFQAFDITFTTAASDLRLRSTATVAGWAEFDDVVVTDAAVDTVDWTPFSSAILSKQAGSPGGSGSQVLRVEYNGTTNPYATQVCTTVGVTYRLTGWGRGDGTAHPRIWSGAVNPWIGTTSATWQAIDVSFVAGSTSLQFFAVTSGASHTEFDDIVVTSDVPDWVDGALAILSKQTTTPHGGAQCLRVADNGATTPYAGQVALTVGVTCRITGWARSDGTAVPQVYISGNGAIWDGTTSTAWQQFDISAVPQDVLARFYGTLSVGNYVEFDDVVITEDAPDWTVDNSAILSKQTTTPHGGSQCLRVAHGGVNSPAAYQSTGVVGTTYRATGWARSDGTGVPLFKGYSTVWTGTTSTAWQAFDVSYVQVTNARMVLGATLTVAGYVEFDDVVVVETTPDWTGGNSALLTKSTTTPYEQLQSLQVEYSTVNYPYAYQAILTVGTLYRFWGYSRGDGTQVPTVYIGSGTIDWTGTTSTAWQAFDTLGVADNTYAAVQSGGVGAGACGFDDMSVREILSYDFLTHGAEVLVDGDMEAGAGSELVTDGDMEAAGTSAWTPASNAVLSKQTTAPQEGLQCLRVERSLGTINPQAVQTILTIGTTYRVTGYGRSDGTGRPSVFDSGGLWNGTASTAWQAFDVTFTAQTTSLLLLVSNTLADGDYAEFDNVSIVETAPAWTAGNAAALTKDTTSPYEGTQVLRIAYNAVNDPYCYQTVLTLGLTYRVRGFMRSDGTGVPELLQGTTQVWLGSAAATTWQEFDVVLTCTATDLRFKCGITGAGYCEVDLARCSTIALP